MNLLLKKLHLYSNGEDRRADIRVAQGRVVEIGEGLRPRRRERELQLDGYLVLPGLINGHDHLELNLYPPLGNPPYPSFYDWAQAIYRAEQPPFSAIQQVALADRLWWGGYKNLMAGATTTVHHNPYYRQVFNRRFPVKVPSHYAWAHSLGYDDQLEERFKKSRGKPFFLHAAEGSDARAFQEVGELERRGFLAPHTVLVHGVALAASDIERLCRAGSSLVWCPSSNLRLYAQTAPISQLKGRLRLALGTDSTLSGSPTLLDELKVARATGMADPDELLNMVTAGAAAALGIPHKGAGLLQEQVPADLVLLPDTATSPGETLLSSTPDQVMLVLVNGEIRMADCSLIEKLDLEETNATVQGRSKWLCGNLKNLKTRLRALLGEELLLQNPLWPILGAPGEP